METYLRTNLLTNTDPAQDVAYLLKYKFGKYRILCLHGGGGSAEGFKRQRGVRDLMAALSDTTFVFGETPEDNGVWIRDPPNGKGEGTEEADWADASVSYIDDLIKREPYHAILGYSQGAAMIAVYLSRTSFFAFDKILLFNGYLPMTHNGLIDGVNETKPFDVRALVFSGEQDVAFGPLSAGLSDIFMEPVTIKSATAGHHLPFSEDNAFQQIVQFITEESSRIV